MGRYIAAPVPEVNDIPLSAFQKAIRATHGARAKLISREYVDERFEGEPVWRGQVLIFELEGHPSAQLCYAREVDGQVTAVLHTGPVDSPVKAVRASILAEADDGGRD